MKILLLSAYDAASHRRWRGGLTAHFPEYQWTQLHLPARYFSWRIRGNSLSWAFSNREVLEGDYDLLIATSMVDLSALRGFVPSLSRLPTLVYFHENQFVYPASKLQQASPYVSVEPQMLNLYTALSADCVVFNSHYNRNSFLSGVEKLLKKLPDAVPVGLKELLQEKSHVLQVPLEDTCFMPRVVSQESNANEPLDIVWNHRWEYDKGPDRLLNALPRLLSSGLRFKLHVVGQQFRQIPVEFEKIRQLLTENNALGEWGYMASVEDYQQLLASSQIVLSTALHDFQGLAVLEAVAAGCVPVVPAREAYPEWFGASSCYESSVEDPEREAQALSERVVKLAREMSTSAVEPLQELVPELERMSWAHLAPLYQEAFMETLKRHG